MIYIGIYLEGLGYCQLHKDKKRTFGWHVSIVYSITIPFHRPPVRRTEAEIGYFSVPDILGV